MGELRRKDAVPTWGRFARSGGIAKRCDGSSTGTGSDHGRGDYGPCSQGEEWNPLQKRKR